MSVTVEKCLQAWTNSLKQMNAKADIVFFGDSLTYYGDFASVFPNKVVCNLGLRGDTIQGMIERVDQVKLLEPKVVFLMAGINDVVNYNYSDFKQNYERLIQTIQKANSSCILVIQSLIPVNTNNFKVSCKNEQLILYNRHIRQLAFEYKIKYVDLYSKYVKENELPIDFTIDGVHLRGEAYSIWYNLLNELKFFNSIR